MFGLIVMQLLITCFQLLDCSNERSILLVIPGFNYHPARTQILINSLSIIYNQTLVDVPVKCILYNYEELIEREAKHGNPTEEQRNKIASYCEIYNYFYANYATYLKTVTPYLVKTSGFSYVFVLLDDVELTPQFEMPLILDIMNRNNLSVISPAINGTVMISNRIHRQFEVGHRVGIVEVFATIFTIQGWECFWDLLDPAVNSAGWGYEIALRKYCLQRIPSFAMGIVDKFVAFHRNRFNKIKKSFLPDGVHILTPAEQRDYWKKLSHTRRNVTLDLYACRDCIGKPLI